MSRARFPDYNTGKKRSSLAQLASERRHKGLIKGKEATPWLPHVRAHTHRSACTRVCTPFPLPCLAPALAGRLSWPDIPSREQLLKDLIRLSYIQPPACNIPFGKKKICLLAWSVTKIIFTSVTLTVSGQEAEIVQSVLLSSSPGLPAREQHCLLGGEGQSPRPSAVAVSSPSGYLLPRCTAWTETHLPQPDIREADIRCKNTHVLNLGREWRVLFFFFREPYPQITCLFISYRCCPPNSCITTVFKYLPNIHICFLRCGYMYMWAENCLKKLI